PAGRFQSRGGGAAVAGGRRDPLSGASRTGGFTMISRRQFLGAVTMMTEGARSLPPSRLAGRSSLEGHRAEAGPQRSNLGRGFNRATFENASAYAVDVTGARRGDVEIARNWSGSV